jgi:hypothetical protein
VAYYRLYFLNAVSGHIDRFEEYDVDDDAAAIERAERRCGAVPLELWSGGRKVRHFALPANFKPRPAAPRGGEHGGIGRLSMAE